MNNAWVQSANDYFISEVSQQHQTLPNGVYKLQINQMSDDLYLSRIENKFHFPFKIYGVETDFVNRVIKSWENTNGNFGVLLNGLKGTGKTVTAEIIANKLNIPVIIVPFHHKKLVSFLNNIQQDVVVFVDEFEKIYDGWKDSLLTIMDGVLKTCYRIFFLLTTNELRVDKNLLQRPSRIRYVKTFEDMSLEVIMEVVDDLLIHPQFRDECIKMISELPIITMDLIKSIIQEVNIHEESPYNFKDIFNIHSDRDDVYNVFVINQEGNKEEFKKFASVQPSYFVTTDQGGELYVDRSYIGPITSILSPTQAIVGVYETNNQDEEVLVHKTFVIEKAVKTHRAFSSYSLTF